VRVVIRCPEFGVGSVVDDDGAGELTVDGGDAAVPRLDGSLEAAPDLREEGDVIAVRRGPLVDPPVPQPPPHRLVKLHERVELARLGRPELAAGCHARTLVLSRS